MTPFRFYIFSGRKNRMFTLRRAKLVPSYGGGLKEQDRHVCNLSNDADTAATKAREYVDTYNARVGGTNVPLDTSYLDNELDQWGAALDPHARDEIEAGRFPFGKHMGRDMLEVLEAEAGYVLFIARVETDRPHMLALQAAMMEIPAIAEAVAAEEKAEADEAARQAKIDTALAAAEYLGTEGEKREFTGVVAKSIAFNGMWGLTRVVTILTDDGGAAVYMGTGAALDAAEAGDRISLTATVKGHSEYNGMKQTKLARPTKVKVDASGAEKVAA